MHLSMLGIWLSPSLCTANWNGLNLISGANPQQAQQLHQGHSRSMLDADGTEKLHMVQQEAGTFSV